MKMSQATCRDRENFGLPYLYPIHTKIPEVVAVFSRTIGCTLYVIYVVVQFYPWFSFDFLLFDFHFHILSYNRTMENQN